MTKPGQAVGRSSGSALRRRARRGERQVGVVALDGTKLAGNSADKANRTLDRLDAEVAEILRQAAEANQRDDLEHGQARDDELPEALASKAGRLARLRQAKALLEAEAAERVRRFAEPAAASAATAAAKGKPSPTLKPRRRDEAPNPKATANVTDPDSRLLHTRRGRGPGLQRPGGHHLRAGNRRRRADPGRQRLPATPTHAQGDLGHT
jgi:hypothetical protein